MSRSTDFSSEPRLERDWTGGGGPSDWSPDGRYVLYTSDDGDNTRRNIWAVPMTDDGEPFQLVATPFDESGGAISPDGRWLAYSSDASAQPEIYLQRLDGMERVGGPQRLTTNGGHKPLWRADGRELFFVSGTHLTVVPIDSDADRPAGTARELFDLGGRAEYQDYAVTPDGASILAIVPTEEAAAPPATVILNWAPDTRRGSR